MSATSEEFRLLNNVAVMLDLGWDIVTAIKAIHNDVSDKDIRVLYDKMLNRLESGDDLGDVLAESQLISNATSRLIIRSGQSAGMLQERLIRTSELVRFGFQGGWDPRRRFLETWAVLVEMGVSLEEALVALEEDFSEQELGLLAHDFLAAKKSSRPLFEVARDYPEIFSTQCCELLRYGEKRNMARALRGIIRLV